MEAVVVNAGSKFLKVGFTILDQAPSMIIPPQMKHTLEDGPLTDSSLFEGITADLVVRGFIRDWDAMEDLLNHGRFYLQTHFQLPRLSRKNWCN
ncbi:hypothetical protein VitviT2T_011607 [Vitis vinifera]|uniref:Actin-related protein 7 n=1 Tax=Vitis vinifera TaxID=29760 RepID=A0ABY9CB80_VITVI|nr:hypothetical protein VitviT2T_011607 [Vitis vinifera]